MKSLFLISMLVISNVTLAQFNPLGAITQWTDGYVITVANDTIQGRVRVGSMVNDSPAGVIVQTGDDKKVKLKGDNLRLIVQYIPNYAYATGNIPRSREAVVFERVPNPRRNGKPMLLERLTPPGGRIALYFDASGWKKTTDYTFGNFTFELNRQEMSYVVLKNNEESLLAKRSDMEAIHETLLGDCPVFVRQYPTATRRDWNHFGEMVLAYNQLCQQQ
ncbi:hypothetical protein [Spirosoma utsteinense]|uniref:DUF4369 domain-containing protein n=1 Tax=Spirosoma utsteinense TaxID=2585773 RepID=A0ABR6W462_9BACT|nr:hypothetical protein [Spirosoma utsteinense]MBC3787058.1 hypothetical protein [Spirosoma utsteinense]MBC3791393.1 hypothetical protein [Spirosoma utsteinense]